jgi:aminoglycoside 3'-phosphotransferase-2
MSFGPASWADRLAPYDAVPQTIGRSGDDVLCLTTDGVPLLFLKSEPVDPLSELPGEAERLRWLWMQGIACPEVVDFTTEAGRHWLLMRALRGRDLASAPDSAPERLVALAADALRQLHGLDITSCPFDHRAALRVARARERLAAGQVDAADLDEPGGDLDLLHAGLCRKLPQVEDLVVTHGDASMPNLMVAPDGAFAGFIDCGRLGVADRWQDLAIATKSIAFNYGDAHVLPFLAHYGAPLDAPKCDWYRLLDEFF